MFKITKIYILILCLTFVFINTQTYNPCSNSNCQNLSKCTPISETNYKCECSNEYWSGKYCSEPTIQNLCYSQPCKQNSSCLFDSIFKTYKCICQSGYTGSSCDSLIDVCSSFPCKNKGYCTNSNQFGVIKPNYYRCICQQGYTGLNCEVQINRCASNPCLNFGICVNFPDSYECICMPYFNGTRCENDYSELNATCVCPSGYYGNRCELETNQCSNTTNPCNSGICIPVGSGLNNLPYTCYCLPGYTGTKCQNIIDICSNSPCKYGGICNQTSPTDYVCTCPEGTLGKNCDLNVDECLSSPCLNNGTCVESSINNYMCNCPSKYVGLNCEVLVIDCNSYCHNGGICIPNPNSASCLCLDGFTGSRCEIDLNPCLSYPCQNNGTCQRGLNGTYICSCLDPYTGKTCETKFDLCSLYNPCLNSANCTSVKSSYFCQCNANYTGAFCETYFSICETNPCLHGKCYETSTGYFKCFCDRGYTGSNCNQVMNTCASNPCKNAYFCTPLINDFVCSCLPGYSSKRCELEINACDSNPCLNEGICLNYFNYYNCSCQPGYLGPNCGIILNPCQSYACSNMGTCFVKFGLPFCQCDSPYYGEICQYTNNYCYSRPCQNAGLCKSNLTSYSCQCTVGFKGQNCELVDNPCTGYCLNGGKCYSDAYLMIGCECPCGFEGLRCEIKTDICQNSLCKNGKCVDNGNCSYSCRCNCDYTGRYCDQKISICDNNKCLNSGICVDNNNCNFTCLCTPGYTGNICQIKKNTCEPNSCLNGATCVDLLNDYSCMCPCQYYTGKNCEFYKNICDVRGGECLNGGICFSTGCDFKCQCSGLYTGTRCEVKIKPCQSTFCQNNGTCLDNNDNTFKCICLEPYSGNDCSQLIKYNSPCDSSPCVSFKTCNQIGQFNYSCSCPPLFTGNRCEIRIKSCSSSPCGSGQCLENIIKGGYSCLCPVGLTGSKCENMIDSCLSSPCLNSANCTQTRPNTFKCNCLPGFTGTLCQTPIDPCISSPCFNEGSCYKPTPGTWACNCSNSCFKGQKCEIYSSKCANINCNNNGICLELSPCDFKCICSKGYTGINCQTQIDPCLSSPCFNSATCVSNKNSWTCNCLPGFSGLRCNNRFLACSSSPCENGGLCQNTPSSYGYKCDCLPGWTGYSCEIDINECSNSNCQNNSTCVEDKINSYKCLCSPGFSGTYCSNSIDMCQSQPCLNAIKCISNSANSTFSCVCLDGYYGTRCEFEANECTSNPCLNNGICIDQIDSYECRCPIEYTGTNCQLVSCLNYCYNGGTCFQSAQTGQAYCSCKLGFDGDRCQNVYDPCSSNPCSAGQGKCVSRYFGYFECFCNIGFTGQYCETKIDVCSINPCIRGICYLPTPGLFKCICPSDYTGKYCEVNLKICEKSPCLNGGSCHHLISYNASSCQDGVTGADCTTVVDVCASNPCFTKSATCVQTMLNTFRCICPPYQTGIFCEKKINLCDQKPCPSQIQCIQTSYTETKCVCPPGYTGTKCLERYDACFSNPCINGNCVSPLPGIMRCNCDPSYKGTFCEESLIICDSITCLNGGYCINNKTANSLFQCICPRGFQGLYCETPINPCQIDANICGSNGKCYYLSPGDFYCKCKNNCYYGTNCELEKDPCRTNNCENQGLCIKNTNCTYTCKCSDGFSGVYCEVNNDPCLSLPCFNDGTCYKNSSTSYECLCGTNYSGRYCETLMNQCNSSYCLNNGICIIDSNFNRPFCLCQYGYTGRNCEKTINFCSNSPCLNGGNCTSSNFGYACNCSIGFYGQNCEVQPDMCALLNPCQYGNCYRGLPGNYICFCYNGWTGKNCDLQISYCKSNPCKNGLCIDSIGGYSCQCSTGYEGYDCSIKIDECLYNPCIYGICYSNITQNVAKNYKCVCDAGFTGYNCNVSINFCENNGNCTNNSTCRQLSPSFAFCDCKPGYTGNKCETVADICDSVYCLNNGICNQIGLNSFKCNCLPGFNGTYCEIQSDFCNPNPCLNSGTCVSNRETYFCACPKNYGGVNCQISQLCDSNPCYNSGVCSKLLDGTIVCTCTPGFTGPYCQNIIDACLSSPCLNNATCYRFNYTQFLCDCKAGYTGVTCSQDKNECLNNPCVNGQCINTYGSYICICPIGYTGSDCADLIKNPCELNSCSFIGTERCIQTNSSYYCKCNLGFNGTHCEQMISPCLSSPCLNNGACIVQAETYTYSCICPSEYYGLNCKFKIDYCTLNRPCGPFGTCNLLNNNIYNCTCFPGYTGTNCNIMIDYCKSVPCLNNATCYPLANSYTCSCTKDYYGKFCESQINYCLNYQCFNNGTCSIIKNTPSCSCLSSYTGSQCEFKIGCQLNCYNMGVCSNDGTKCICKNGWTGIDCSSPIIQNPCLSSPCKNGTCIQTLNTSFLCNCFSDYTGAYCENKITICDKNPCTNGVCSELNSTSYTCKCFQPYTGTNCETKLSLCNFINCGQGSCVVRNNSVFDDVYCNCLPSYTGQYCNLKIENQGCLSSPCKNGATCVNLDNGRFACNCTPEYTGINCATLKSCVPGYDYCSSLPCLNNGVCTSQNCTFVCNCNISTSFGEFCQFTRIQATYSKLESLNTLLQNNIYDINFDLEIKPCILQAWENSNPKFSCPAGFEIISGIADRCFLTKALNSSGLTKATSQYNCNINGGFLAALETLDKYTAVINWLINTKKSKSKYFWLNSALLRSNQTSPSWVWTSGITKTVQTIPSGIWGPFQSESFDGDSIYLNTNDFKLYVDMGNQVPSLLSSELAGILCESKINSLADNQINIVRETKETVYTSQGQIGVRFNYTSNIVLEDNVISAQVNPPNITLYRQTLKDKCGKTFYVNNIDGFIFTIDQSFYIDICGSVLPSHIDSIKNSLLNAWLIARPEFIWCSSQRNCLKIYIILNQAIKIDDWNQFTRLNYVITINDVILYPNHPNSSPTSDIIKSYIEQLKKNYYQNYVLCGVMVDSYNNFSFISPSVLSTAFPLVFNRFSPKETTQTQVNALLASIKNSINILNSNSRQFSIDIVLSNVYKDVVVLTSFDSIQIPNTIQLSSFLINNPSTLTTFQILINGAKLSYIAQSAFDEAQFYTLIQQQISLNDQLKSLNLNIFNPNYQPIIKLEDIFYLTLTTRLLPNDVSSFESFINNFIRQNYIEFNLCKSCWNDSASFSAKFINTDTLVNSQAKRYFDLWFIVVLKNPITRQLFIPELSTEYNFQDNFKLNKISLFTQINSLKIGYKDNNTFYFVYQGDKSTELRRLSDAYRIQLTQSVLYEDITPITNIISSSIKVYNKFQVNIEYWGQIRFLTSSNNLYYYYWQVIFFITRKTVTSSNQYNTLNPNYEFEISQSQLNSFFTKFNSTRLNYFNNNIQYNPITDYYADDLFYLPCFGLVSTTSYSSIIQILNDQWKLLYNSKISNLQNIQAFQTFIVPYVNIKGSYSVIPYGLKLQDSSLLTPDLYLEPSLSNLKITLSGLCDIQDSISQVYEQDSLNYIQVDSVLTLDQAQLYLPTISTSYNLYFSSMPNNIIMSKPPVIYGNEVRLVDQKITTRIYYQINANTTQPFNAFNYQIKYTNFKIQSVNTIKSRSISARADKTTWLDTARITDVILQWLPAIAIEKELTFDDNAKLANALLEFWKYILKNNDVKYTKLEVKLAIAQTYYTQSLTYLTYVYYLIGLDDVIKYSAEMPKINETDQKLKEQLNLAGFKLNQNEQFKARKLYFDLNTVVVNFDFKLTAESIKNAWLSYLSTVSSLNLDNSLVNVSIIDQHLYYDNEKPIIGISYIISLKNKDPKFYVIPDPLLTYFTPYFSNFKISASTPLLSRRLYAYGTLIKDLNSFKDPGVMKDQISNLWIFKNTPNVESTNYNYVTNYYNTVSGYFYNTFPNVPIYRATYTQSVNAIEPIPLFNQIPNEIDFNNQFLNLSNRLIMGFCFKNCYNYRQNALFISPNYTQQPTKLLEAIKEAWVKSNQINSPLINPVQLQVMYLTNDSFLLDLKSGLSIVIFNTLAIDPYGSNIYDSIDLNEPTGDLYYSSLKKFFPELAPDQLQSNVTISTLTTSSPKTSTQQPNIIITSSSSLGQTPAATTSMIVKSNSNNIEWWGWLLIAFGIIIFILLVLTIGCIIYKLNIYNKKSTIKSSSFSGSFFSSKSYAKDYVAILANSHDALTDVTDITPDIAEFNMSNLKFLNPELNSEPVFTPQVKPNAIKTENITLFYPGLSINSIIPNPMYSKKDDELITNVYVTNNKEEIIRSPNYYTGDRDIETNSNNAFRNFKKWSDLTKEKSLYENSNEFN